MFTKLMASYPPDGEELDSYTVDEDTEVTIFRVPGDVRYIYHITPPEFKLNEEMYELLDMARTIMAEHKPKRDEFVEPERMRRVFYNVGHDLLEELANYKSYNMSQKELDRMTEILVRYTVGFGLIEVLLKDEKIQDISINSPMGKVPMFIVHDDYGDCRTNIVPTNMEAESWASKLRMISGRPLDEANQILDTELELPGASTRVSVIAPPLNPTGLAYSFRRHRDRPWTLPLFIKANMLTPLAAGLLSFLIDGTRTLLIAGTRSSGKTSLLSAMLIEIMRRYRMITVEDTLELPTSSLRKLGYNIQSMKVASALSKGTSEMTASDGIRATLRLGDSALIVGEVRSAEAIALYEAMRIGAAANVVAGTIHSDSPYGVFDRVVNDIGIPRTSFKATDIIVVANPIKSPDGMHSVRRVTQITEVRKLWNQDPLLENAFCDLMRYDAKSDQLSPTDEIINGESEILKTIAGNVKEFAGDWDAVWNNILLRAKIKEAIVNYAEQLNNPELLEAEFVIKCNDAFHLVSEKIKEELGNLDSARIFTEWENWLKRELKRKKIQ
jgi:type IV secretory pathway ATPase VirB11/archaellum biosynthesis ATPase